jgi:hypothetical protein
MSRFLYSTNCKQYYMPIRYWDHEIQQDTPITYLHFDFESWDVLNRDVAHSQCQPLLTWLTSTTTLSNFTVISSGQQQDPMGAVVFQWILRALLDRLPTLPAISYIEFSHVNMTTEDMERLVQVCRPERLKWVCNSIRYTSLCPTNRQAMFHSGTALRTTSASCMSPHLCLSGGLLRGLQNYNDYFSIEVSSSSFGGFGTPEDANDLTRLLQQSTGEWKAIRFLGSHWLVDPVFESLVSAFRDSSSCYELGFADCKFDVASSNLLCDAFSSLKPKAINICGSVIFSSSVDVLEKLAGSSPALGHIEVSGYCVLSRLEGILRGLVKNTSTVQKLILPTLAENQFNLILDELPKFTHLLGLKFATVTVPLSLKRKLLLAFKRNGCLVESMVSCPILDQMARDKLAAYHSRNAYLPMAFKSAIDEKTTEEIDNRSGEFSFRLVPSLLKSAIVATTASQGPTRVFDVLVRCKDLIGPRVSRKRSIPEESLPETLSCED